jgi:SMC interacting uncharacterized protein involved in chromosome segregation
MKRHVTTAEVRAHRKKVVEDSKKLTAQLKGMNSELHDYLNDISEMLYDLEKIGEHVRQNNIDEKTKHFAFDKWEVYWKQIYPEETVNKALKLDSKLTIGQKASKISKKVLKDPIFIR